MRALTKSTAPTASASAAVRCGTRCGGADAAGGLTAAAAIAAALAAAGTALLHTAVGIWVCVGRLRLGFACCVCLCLRPCRARPRYVMLIVWRHSAQRRGHATGRAKCHRAWPHNPQKACQPLPCRVLSSASAISATDSSTAKRSSSGWSRACCIIRQLLWSFWV